MKWIMILCCFIFLGCQTVTISEKNYQLISSPQFEQTQYFFLWGLIPDVHEIEIKRICQSGRVRQMQTQDTFVDQLITVLTVGFAAPKTAKIWCEK